MMMRRLANTGLFALILLGGSTVGAEVNIGINIGAPPPPRVVYVHPPRPNPEFVWIEGYWYPKKGHYHWHDGYWTQLPYDDARWVALATMDKAILSDTGKALIVGTNINTVGIKNVSEIIRRVVAMATEKRSTR